MSRITTFAICMLLAVGHVFAQSVPPLMNYQGQLTNASGQPLADGQYTLTFNVYNVPTGGTAVWGPQAIVADVVDGHFNVVLSSDTTGGDSITTAFVAQPRYVSIKVNAAAEILPRQQVLSAPYAIQSEKSARADLADRTQGAANVFPGSGNVGIGTTTPDRALVVQGAGLVTGALNLGSLAVGGAASVSGTATVGTLIVGGPMQFDGQKYCRATVPGGWTSLSIVPNTWQSSHCDTLRFASGGTQFYLVCIFSDGQASQGAVNGGVPTRNCGW